MNNLLSYCGLVDAKIRASEIDLPVQSEMSKTLDQLLGPNYNKRIRPNYGGPPVLVELNLSIRSIVSDTIE